jgi:hypothetical protein
MHGISDRSNQRTGLTRYYCINTIILILNNNNINNFISEVMKYARHFRPFKPENRINRDRLNQVLLYVTHRCFGDAPVDLTQHTNLPSATAVLEIM